MNKRLLAAVSIVAISLPVEAADLQSKSQAAPAPIFSGTPLQVEFGTRYWLSNGGYVKNLYDTEIPNQLNSRLSYSNATGQSAEVFWRLDHETGVFAKGFLGGGSLTSGKMNDEDFAPAISPYSNTISVQSGGSLKYLTVDLGYNFLRGTNPAGLPYKIGAFVGYNNFHERYNTFGCNQVSFNQDVCGSSIPTSFDGLDENTSWNSLRVGLGGEVTLLPGIRASLEGAWLRNWFYAADYHNLRSDIRGLSQTGSGQGAQVEGILNYDITPKFSIGIGGRYWIMNAQSKAHWEQTFSALAAPTNSAPLSNYSQRYGGFLQAAYRFGGPNDTTSTGAITPNFGKAENEIHDWNGIFIGGNVGYGFGNTGITTLSALSDNALDAQFERLVPLYTRSDIAGFIGGGQIGYNYKLTAPVIIGLETDLSYANNGGSIGMPGILGPMFNSNKSLLTWLGTVRGRAGYLIRDDILLYGTAGMAYGNLTASGASWLAITVDEQALAALGQYDSTDIGWTAGAGLEYAVAKNWSLKAEWLYVGFGDKTYGISPIPFAAAYGFNATVNNDIQLIKTGINYRIDFADTPARVTAKY